MRIASVALVSFLLACSKHTPPVSQGKVYSMDDVSKELSDGGVQLNGSPDNVHAFFTAHPAYAICRDNAAGVIAVMRNSKIDPKADDQYIVIVYRDGKVAGLDIGPAMFSAGNVASYCA